MANERQRPESEAEWIGRMKSMPFKAKRGGNSLPHEVVVQRRKMFEAWWAGERTVGELAKEAGLTPGGLSGYFGRWRQKIEKK